MLSLRTRLLAPGSISGPGDRGFAGTASTLLWHPTPPVSIGEGDCQLLEDAILGTKTSLVSVRESWDLGNPGERILAGVQALFDGQYRLEVSKRNRDAALTRAQLGCPLGDVGYGWGWEPRTDVLRGGRRWIFPVPEEGQWVAWMKEQYLAGASLMKLTADLNALQVPSPGKTKWHFGTVQKVLWNPLHAGLIPSRVGLLRGEHYERRYWDPEVLEQLKEAAASRRRWAKTNTAKQTVHLLNGLAHCSRCGERLYSQSFNEAQRVYYCRSGQSTGKRTCPGVRVPEERVDRVVVDYLAEIAREPRMQALLQEEAQTAVGERDATLRAEAAQLRGVVESLRERRDALLEALARKTITDARYQEYEPKLLAEQAATQKRLGEVTAELQNRQRREAWAEAVKEAVLQFPLVWKHLEVHERRESLSQLLERLTIDRNDRTVTLRMKVHLLPEREITLDLGKRYRPKKRHQTGVLSLTKRELAALYWISEGKAPQEGAVLMGVSYTTFRQWLYLVRKKLGTHVLADAVAQAQAQIKVMLPQLPIHHLNSPQYDGETIHPSARILALLPYFANGASVKETARETGLPESTVSGRRQRLFYLLGAKTTYEMVQKARKLGLI